VKWKRREVAIQTLPRAELDLRTEEYKHDSARFLLIYHREDDIVDPATQSKKFLTALKQAGFYARTIVVPGAGHFWASEPLDEPSSFGAYAAPKMLRFLQTALYAMGLLPLRPRGGEGWGEVGDSERLPMPTSPSPPPLKGRGDAPRRSGSREAEVRVEVQLPPPCGVGRRR